MKDCVFIQFYSYYDSPPCYDLGNGFSDVYDFCQNKGEFFWVEHPMQIIGQHEKDWPTDFPINKGTAYISASYTSHLHRCFVWAESHPDVKFVVGGPVVTCNFQNALKQIPKNLLIVKESAEKYFGFKDFSQPWNLNIPKDLPHDHPIVISYTLDNYCYWGKCIFCAFSKESHNPVIRRREVMNFEFDNLVYDGKMIVRLNTEALIPSMIRKVVPILPQGGFTYRAFMRPSSIELEALKTLKSPIPYIKFSMGLEYPNQRMWDYIHKGYNKKDVLDIFQLLVDKKSGLSYTMIFGWNNLVESDLIDLEKFMIDVPVQRGDSSLRIHRLFAYLNTEVYKTYDKGKDLSLGPFYMGFYPKISKKQLDLNKRSKEIVVHYAKERGIYLQDSCDLDAIEEY